MVLGLLVNEFCDFSPWLAKRVVRWAAMRWTPDPTGAADLAEEWAAVVEERPGKIFKLVTAVGFAAGAIRDGEGGIRIGGGTNVGSGKLFYLDRVALRVGRPERAGDSAG